MIRPTRTRPGLLAAAALLALVTTGHPALAQGRIDVNTASVAELTRLPGIGGVKARRIVAYRAAHGRFASVAALRLVKGIGKATLARIRDRITLGKGDPAPRADDAPAPGKHRDEGRGAGYDLDLTRAGGTGPDPAPGATRTRLGGGPARHPRPRHATKDPPTGKINVNTASARELQKLPGIGPAKSRAIVTQRTAQGPFRRVDEIVEVPGIGWKTLEKLRPFVTVKVDLNRADLHDLEAIGLDTASAERLLAWRHRHGRFRRVADLTQVPGFGKGALVTLRPLVRVSAP